MQHIQAQALHFVGHGTVWRTVKYLSLAIAGLVAVFDHSPGLLIILAIAVVMVLALTERAGKLEARLPANPPAPGSRQLGDGGSFPGSEPETEPRTSGTPRVLDGGSL